MEALLTSGPDPERKRFIGSWTDSVFDPLWIYDGSFEDGGKILSLESDGPSCAGDGKSARHGGAFECKSADHDVLTSSMQGADGTWTNFMTANDYR